jgi:hypothetical protein
MSSPWIATIRSRKHHLLSLHRGFIFENARPQ